MAPRRGEMERPLAFAVGRAGFCPPCCQILCDLIIVLSPFRRLCSEGSEPIVLSPFRMLCSEGSGPLTPPLPHPSPPLPHPPPRPPLPFLASLLPLSVALRAAGDVQPGLSPESEPRASPFRADGSPTLADPEEPRSRGGICRPARSRTTSSDQSRQCYGLAPGQHQAALRRPRRSN